MTKLTNDLLYLARIDHDDGNVIFSKVSFSEGFYFATGILTVNSVYSFFFE